MIVKNKDRGSRMEVLKTTLNDDKITFVQDTTTTPGNDIIGFGKFVIYDAYGNKYYFHQQEDVSFWQVQPLLKLGTGDSSYKTVSSSHLSRIESADGSDWININYLRDGINWTQNMVSHSKTSSRTIEGDGANGFRSDSQWSEPLDIADCTVSRRVYKNCKFISSIEFNGGRVEFSYVDDGLEILHQAHDEETTNTNMPKRLSMIKIIEDGKAAKIFEMKRGIFGDNRPKLDGIDVYLSGSNDKTVYDSYTFEYYKPENAPGVFSQDIFGYYNGQNNKDLTFLQLLPSHRNEYHKRSYNFDCAKIYALTAIKKRRGEIIKNTTCFNYEHNQHTFNESDYLPS
jgi:hypothetical protein